MNTILRKYFCLIAVLYAGLFTQGFAQKAVATLDTNAIMIGQQVPLQLSISYRADNGKHIKIDWPQPGDTLRKEIEVVRQSALDTIIDKKDPLLITQHKTIYITSFDSGYWAIPPFNFYVKGDTSAIQTEPLLLQVSPVAVDTTKDIRDIKAPYQEEYTWIDWIKDHKKEILIALAATLVLAAIIFWLIKNSKKKVPEKIVEAPKIPPHIIALQKLEQLRSAKLWQDGKLKQYHSELTDILREYIEGRFKIAALEQTTDEILFGFRNIAIDEESKQKLKQTLVLADLVKFAKEHPLPAENDMSLSNAHDFIEGTKREEELNTNGNKTKEKRV
jgi:hypothetical protein